MAEISCQDRPQRWLVEQLWGASSVGLIGGAPKCSKTGLGLDLALSVATGTACLGRYAVPEPGPVLVYLAEDALPILRQRVEGMARHRGLNLQQVENVAIRRDHCHKCHSQGNQLELWAAFTKREMHPAMIDLCHALGREIPWIRRW